MIAIVRRQIPIPRSLIPVLIKNKISAIFDRSTIFGASRFFQQCVRSGDIESALSSFHDDVLYFPGPKMWSNGRLKYEMLLNFYAE